MADEPEEIEKPPIPRRKKCDGCNERFIDRSPNAYIVLITTTGKILAFLHNRDDCKIRWIIKLEAKGVRFRIKNDTE